MTTELDQKLISEEETSQLTEETLQAQLNDLTSKYLSLKHLVERMRDEQVNLASTVKSHHAAMEGFGARKLFTLFSGEFVLMLGFFCILRIALKLAFFLLLLGVVWFIFTSILVYLFPSLSPPIYEFMIAVYSYTVSKPDDVLSLIPLLILLLICLALYSDLKLVFTNSFKFFLKKD